MTTGHATRNRSAYRRFHDAVNTGDAEVVARAIDEVFAPDAVIRTPLRLDATGAQAMKEVFGRLLRAFPDLHVAVEDVIEEGDRLVSRNVVTGTHLGDHMGIAPTGRPVAYDEIFILRFADGRVVETWGVVDVLAQLRQLGAVPETTKPPAGGPSESG
jgi:predicted ester cyclase